MFAVETYAAVRQFIFVEGKNRREAARVFGLSRETISKMMFFHDSELLAIKWRNFKVHFLMRDAPRGEVVAAGQGVTHGVRTQPNYPWIFDIENDPKELWDISFTNGWLGPAVGRILQDYQKSVEKFPNIKPGAEGPGAN